LVTAARAAFPSARLGTGYGLTETASFCTYLPDEFAESRSDTVGPAVPVVDLRLHEAGPGGVGELLARGPNVTPGYWAHGGPPNRGSFIDGWLRTGDLAHIASDGFVQIVDRIKDVIFRGGETIYSAVLRFAREHLARHKTPELVAVWTRPLPRNPGGKVMKPQIRAMSAWTIAPR
jgi:acyl-CoA synthetase (AMP-forming)/AMP-acid ligase II